MTTLMRGSTYCLDVTSSDSDRVLSKHVLDNHEMKTDLYVCFRAVFLYDLE
jgi:hypothetical protein